MQTLGLNPDKHVDVDSFYAALRERFSYRGCAVLLIDHVAKSAEGTVSPIGSERKLSGIDGASIGFNPKPNLNKGASGCAILKRHKDRYGVHPHGVIGHIKLESDGEKIDYRIELAKDGAKPLRNAWGVTRTPASFARRWISCQIPLLVSG